MRKEIKQMANTCASYHSCACCPYSPEDISRFIGDEWKGGCPNYDRKLVYAMGKGYGDVSQYEAEIKRLNKEMSDIRKETAEEFAKRICEMLWNLGIGKDGNRFSYGDLTSENVLYAAKQFGVDIDDRLCKENNIATAHMNKLVEQDAEIERLKTDYAKLQEQFAQYQMASDKEIRAQKEEAEKRFESNMKAVLEIEKKQAQVDVLNKLKERIETAIDTYYNKDGGGYYLAEDVLDDVGLLIEEVQNEN